MDDLLHFLEVFTFCVGALILTAAALFILVCYLPSSPLKEMLRSFSHRVAATAAVGLVGLLLQPIPGVDGIYDIGGLIFLAIYWYGFIHKLRYTTNVLEAQQHLMQNAPLIRRLLAHCIGRKR